MRGTVAKKLRRIVFELVTQGKIAHGSKYVLHGGTIALEGTAATYRKMKRLFHERGGLVGPKPKVLTKRDRVLIKQEKARESRLKSRWRRRTRERDRRVASHY